MQIVELSKIPCFNTVDAVNRLNDLLQLRKDFMPHEFAIATGCGIDDSASVLMLLHMHGLAEAYLLVYHNNDDDPRPYTMKRKLLDGMPKPPFICEVCGQEIVNKSELSYDFSFTITGDVEFVIGKEVLGG